MTYKQIEKKLNEVKAISNNCMEWEQRETGNNDYFTGINIIKPIYTVIFDYSIAGTKDNYIAIDKAIKALDRFINRNRNSIKASDRIYIHGVRAYRIMLKPDFEKVNTLESFIDGSVKECEEADHRKRETTGELLTESEYREIMNSWKQCYLDCINDTMKVTA